MAAVSQAPPLMRQSELFRTEGTEAAFGGSSRLLARVDQASEAYRHVKSVVTAMGDRRGEDLYDLLSSTRREETYQPYFQGVGQGGGRQRLHSCDRRDQPRSSWANASSPGPRCC